MLLNNELLRKFSAWLFQEKLHLLS